MANFKNPKFLTLTQLKKGNKENGYFGTVERLKRIWECRKALFKEIRRRGYKIVSWCGVCEPPNHIHLVIDAPSFIPWRTLSNIWKTVTGDSYIVDIREVKKDKQRLASYLAKYISKASAYTGFISSEDFDDQEHFEGWKPKPVSVRINLEQLKGFHLKASDNLNLDPPKKLTCDHCAHTGTMKKIYSEEFRVLSDYYENQERRQKAEAIDRIRNIHHVPL